MSTEDDEPAAPTPTIVQSAWDRADFDDTEILVTPLAEAGEKLAEVSRVGRDMGRDVFAALHKRAPRPVADVPESHRINAVIRDETLEAPSYRELHDLCVGDPFAAALGVRTMLDELVGCYNRHEDVQEAADAAQEAADALSEALADALDGNPDGELDGDTQARLDALGETAAQAAAAAAAAADEATASIGRAARAAVDAATERLADEVAMAAGWGVDRGQLAQMDPTERLRLASELNTDLMRRIADMFGRVRALAFGAMDSRWVRGPDEVYDICLDNDISRVLPSELAGLCIPALRRDFYRRFAEAELLCYDMRRNEPVGRGGIVLCEDSSDSMWSPSVEPHVWAKAVGLALASIATAQDRRFTGIIFGGPGQIGEYPVTAGDSTSMLAYAKARFTNAGTDFKAPLTRAVKILSDEHDRDSGRVGSDIVFVTDGIANLDSAFVEWFDTERSRLGFRLWAITIGRATPPVLTRIADRTVEIVNMFDTDKAVTDLFADVSTTPTPQGSLA